eukprot:15079824-Alexandrium_andersonii.AAC.1
MAPEGLQRARKPPRSEQKARRDGGQNGRGCGNSARGRGDGRNQGRQQGGRPFGRWRPGPQRSRRLGDDRQAGRS